VGGGGRWGLVEMWRAEGMECIDMLYQICKLQDCIVHCAISTRGAPALSASASLNTLTKL
jgi:hypothetical protein